MTNTQISGTQIFVLLGVFVATLVVKALFNKVKEINEENKKNAVPPVEQQTADTKKTADTKTVQATALETVKSVTNNVLFRYGIGVIALIIVFFLLWSFISPNTTNVAGGKNNFAPYLLAPLFGLFSYYFDGRRSKNLTFSFWVTVMTGVAIFFFIKPQVVMDMFQPFSTAETIHRIFRDGSWGLPCLVGLAIAYLVWDGKFPEALMLTILALIFFVSWIPSPYSSVFIQ